MFKRIIFSFVVVFILYGSVSAHIFAEEPFETDDVFIHFIDTGQSAAILIKINEKIVLSDSGDKGDDYLIYDYLLNQGVRQIDYFIVTHFHQDHIGGADTVMDQFDVKLLIQPFGDHDTYTYDDYIESIIRNKVAYKTPTEGYEIQVDNTTFTFYNTAANKINLNDDSLVVLLDHGKDQILFMGDAESNVEYRYKDFFSNISLLKAGHHGANSSSKEFFIKAIRPKNTVITVGKDNEYGYPNQEVIDTFEKYHTEIYRTDLQGSIIFESTGSGVISLVEPIN